MTASVPVSRAGGGMGCTYRTGTRHTLETSNFSLHPTSPAGIITGGSETLSDGGSPMESHCSISANACHDGRIESKGNFLVKYRDGKISIWDTKSADAKVGEFDEDNENQGYAKAEEFIENLFK